MNAATGQGGDVRVVDLPVIPGPRGVLTRVEGQRPVPFDARRVHVLGHLLHDALVGPGRGGRAHRPPERATLAPAASVRPRIGHGPRTRGFPAADGATGGTTARGGLA